MPTSKFIHVACVQSVPTESVRLFAEVSTLSPRVSLVVVRGGASIEIEITKHELGLALTALTQALMPVEHAPIRPHPELLAGR